MVKYPCTGCIVDACCSCNCDASLDYYSRLIKSYAKYGERSLLMKHATKQLPYKNIKRMKRGINDFSFIRLTNKISGKFHVFNRNGTVIGSGDRINPAYHL